MGIDIPVESGHVHGQIGNAGKTAQGQVVGQRSVHPAADDQEYVPCPASLAMALHRLCDNAGQLIVRQVDGIAFHAAGALGAGHQ